jgi:hypothetical protein
MKKISSNYGLDMLGYNQHNVDFLDVYLGIDNPLFIDYNKILMGASPLHKSMKSDIDIFMKNLFQHLVHKNDLNLGILLHGLHETNATHLGMSKNNPKGNSVGDDLKNEMIKSLKFLRKAFLKGNLEIDSIYFGIENIGPDRISDIVTSIIKSKLISFTNLQCIKHGITTHSFAVTNIFNSTNGSWETRFVNLPVYDGKPVIFIPKDIVSSYVNISGSFHSFIRYGFNHFFKNSLELKRKIRGNDGDLVSKISRKEFDHYNKENHLNNKAISQKILSEFDNAEVVNIFSEIRKNVIVISDDQLIDIIEDNIKKAN